MIFKNSDPIDSNLINLVAKLKKLSEENPDIKIAKDHWVLSVKEPWVSIGTINISYYRLHARPYRLWWAIEKDCLQEVRDSTISIGNFKDLSSTKDCIIVYDTDLILSDDVITTLMLLKLINLGIPSDIIDYLSEKCWTIGLDKAIQSIATETDLTLSLEHMKVLGIEKDRGRISGRKFGI